MESFSVLDLVGQTIEYKYRILRLMSVDPKGALYEGELLGHSHRVAIKALFPDIKIKPAGTFALEHPNIVQIYEAIVTSEHQYFIVTDRPRGKSLKNILELTGKLSIGPAVSATLQLLSALHAIHINGRICGNLNPDNIFISLDKVNGIFVSLLDIGVVDVATVPDNPFYLSPEQVVNEGDIDLRSDIWAMGVVLFEMLMGGRPFNGENQDEICSKILLKDPPIPKRTNLSPELVNVLNRCLAKDVQDRYESVGAMVNELLPIHEKYVEPMSPMVLQALRDSIPPPPDASSQQNSGIFDFEEPETAVFQKPVPSTFGFLMTEDHAPVREDATAPTAVPEDLLNKLGDPTLGQEYEQEDESELLERLTRPGDFIWGEDELPPPPVEISTRATEVLAKKPALLGDKIKKAWFFARENWVLIFRRLAYWLEVRSNRYIMAGIVALAMILAGAGVVLLLSSAPVDSSGETGAPAGAAPKPPVQNVVADASEDTETEDMIADDEVIEQHADSDVDTESDDGEVEEDSEEDTETEDVVDDEFDGDEALLETGEPAVKQAPKKRQRKPRKSGQKKDASKKKAKKARWASNPFEE